MNAHPSRIFSAELLGISAKVIEVEADLTTGLHAFHIVGLADKALSEARERVNSALKNSGIKPPNRENRRITVNLAPADIKKTGSQYDLAIALAYLSATGQIKAFDAHDKIFLGELALDGRLRPISGALNIAEMAREKNFQYVFLPRANANEASAIQGITIIPVEHLKDVIAILEETAPLVAHVFEEHFKDTSYAPDLSEIKGQENAKRALIIAAAGGHNLLMSGPPGVGKSLLAQALIGILPHLTREESIAITKIWSAAGHPLEGLVAKRPFRSPHQTSSVVALVGGGTEPRPGEISLAHHGILFLDELPEFQRSALEALRAPLESGMVYISRAQGTLKFPARFTLIAAMNPCPCGYYGDSEKECVCGAYEIARYQKKISGPLLDRIDLQIRVPRVAMEQLREKSSAKNESTEVKKKIEETRILQAERFKSSPRPIITNSQMSAREAEGAAHLDAEGERFLARLSASRISPRGYYRLLKTARTIADLENTERVSAAHLAEAFSYRLREE